MADDTLSSLRDHNASDIDPAELLSGRMAARIFQSETC